MQNDKQIIPQQTPEVSCVDDNNNVFNISIIYLKYY